MKLLNLLLIICLFLVVTLNCQKVLIDNYDSSEQISPKQHKLRINNLSDNIVLYGWIKFQPLNEAYTNIPIIGLRNLEYIEPIIQLSILQTEQKQYYFAFIANQQHIEIEDSDFDQWIFFALSYDSNSKKQQTFIKFPNKQIQSFKYYQNLIICDILELYYGKNNIDQFQGMLTRIILNNGEILENQDPFKSLTILNPSDMPECTVVFSKSGFAGQYQSICDKNNFQQHLFQIYSIFLNDAIPYIYYEFSQNLQIKYSKSVDCIDYHKSFEDMNREYGIEHTFFI